MVHMINTDDVKSLALSLAGEIALFVRNDLVAQKAIPLQSDALVLTGVLSRHVPSLSQKIEDYLLEDTPVSLQEKEQALRTATLLFKGQGGLVQALVQQSKELSRLVDEKKKAIQVMHDEEMARWTGKRTKNGKQMLDETEKRMQSLHSNNFLTMALNNLQVTLDPKQAQNIAAKCCVYLIKEAKQYTLQSHATLENNAREQDASDQREVHFELDVRQLGQRQILMEETRENIKERGAELVRARRFNTKGV